MLTSNGNLIKINYIKFYMKLFILKYNDQRDSLAGRGASHEAMDRDWFPESIAWEERPESWKQSFDGHLHAMARVIPIHIKISVKNGNIFVFLYSIIFRSLKYIKPLMESWKQTPRDVWSKTCGLSFLVAAEILLAVFSKLKAKLFIERVPGVSAAVTLP